MDAPRSPDRTERAPSALTRAAGALVVLLGIANIAFGVMSLTSDLVRLSPAAAGGLLVAGLLLTWVGVLVHGGSKAARVITFALFGALLILEVGALAGGGDGSAARVGVLVAVGALLGAALVRDR